MVGVCDGHGIHGHLVSNYVKINLPKILLELIWKEKRVPQQVDKSGFLPPLNDKNRSPRSDTPDESLNWFS